MVLRYSAFGRHWQRRKLASHGEALEDMRKIVSGLLADDGVEL